MPKKPSQFEKDLIAGMEEAVAIHRGERKPASVREVTLTLRDVTTAPNYSGDDIAAIRHRMGVTQAAFADVLNASLPAVRAWEQGQRSPDGIALRMLQVLDANPDAVLTAIKPKRTRKKAK